MLLVSDNGAAVALADRVDGSVPAFAKRMNERAAVLGMKHTHFEILMGSLCRRIIRRHGI